MRTRVTGLAALALLGGCATAVTDLRQGEVGWVSYPSTHESLQLSGELILPTQTPGPYPAMIIAHASGGLDARNAGCASGESTHPLRHSRARACSRF